MGDHASDAATEERSRARTYALLAELFAKPPERALLLRLEALADTSGDGPVAMAWRALGEAAREADPESVDDEYHALFIGVGRGEILPYGSWYLTGFLMGRPLVRLRSELAALGFERETGVTEPEDHVAALFDVMAAHADPEAGDAATTQQRFFSEFLAPWVERFMSDVRLARSAGLFREIAALGERFMVLEKQYLGLAEGAAPLAPRSASIRSNIVSERRTSP